MSDQIATTEDEGGVVPKKYREKYGKDKHCGDEVAVAMKLFTTDDKGKLDEKKLRRVAKDNGVDFSKYEGMNTGMQRMNVGNVLRGKANRGEMVTIGDRTWEADPSAQKPEKKKKKKKGKNEGEV